jgi:hypothetical protein
MGDTLLVNETEAQSYMLQRFRGLLKGESGKSDLINFSAKWGRGADYRDKGLKNQLIRER